MFLLNNEKGAALPLVLIVMIVLTLLGTALWYYGVNELGHSVREEKKARAYYIARAGAESVAKYIISDPSDLHLVGQVGDKISSAEEGFSINNDQYVGDIEVEIEKVDGNQIKVTGIGTVDEITQRVSLVLETQQIPDGTLIMKSDVKFSQGINIYGDVVSGGKVYVQNKVVEGDTHSIVNGGTIKQNQNFQFTTQPFPGVPEEVVNFDIDQYEESTINSDPGVTYQEIYLANKEELTVSAESSSVFLSAHVFDMHSGAELTLCTSEYNDLQIVADEIEMAKVEVKGDGVVEIYARERITFKTPHSYVDKGFLVVYLEDDCVMTIQANSKFRGLIYGPGAKVEIAGGIIEGVIVADKITGAGPASSGQGQGSEYVGDGSTEVNHKDLWSGIGYDYGGYWMVHWIR